MDFDRVWRQGLWTTMNRLHIHKGLKNCIGSLHNQSMFSVLVGGIMSNPFKTNTGVRQGCPLSPFLFNLFLEQIMAQALDGFEVIVSIGGSKIYNLRFADDIHLIVGTAAELADLTDRLDTSAILYGMEISLDKSKVLNMSTETLQQVIVMRGGK